jgi:hypothetical protein
VYASDVVLLLNYLNIARVLFTSSSLSKSRGKQAVVVIRGTVLWHCEGGTLRINKNEIHNIAYRPTLN